MSVKSERWIPTLGNWAESTRFAHIHLDQQCAQRLAQDESMSAAKQHGSSTNTGPAVKLSSYYRLHATLGKSSAITGLYLVDKYYFLREDNIDMHPCASCMLITISWGLKLKCGRSCNFIFSAKLLLDPELGGLGAACIKYRANTHVRWQRTHENIAELKHSFDQYAQLKAPRP
eukprot:366278-Chlamydomonas_euryale.AAC.48